MFCHCRLREEDGGAETSEKKEETETPAKCPRTLEYCVGASAGGDLPRAIDEREDYESDIANFIGTRCSDSKKYDILVNLFRPQSSHKFPKTLFV